MKIRMLTSMAGARFVLSPGDETTRFGNQEAARLVEKGYAEPVREQVREKAVKKPRIEKAAK